MLSSSDLVVLPYDAQFSRAGAQYARDSLHFTYNRMRLPTADRLRKIVVGVAFEMATRRWLEAAAIRYNRLGATAFTDPDRFDLAIGGRRCDLKCSLIYDKRKMLALHADPGWALDAAALVPEDQFDSERLSENDIYLFGFVTGREARQSTDTEQALVKRLPVYLVHIPPREVWAARWRSLGELTLTNNADTSITLEIGGQDKQRQAIHERVRLLPHAETLLQPEFYSVLHLALGRLPGGVIELRSEALGRTQRIGPFDWANIWVYGSRVYLCGWLNKRDFRQRSCCLPAQSRVKQYNHTAYPNRALPIGKLRSMSELAETVQKHAIINQ